MKILTYPNEILRKMSTPIEDNGTLTKMIVKKLIKTLQETPKGIGLSAPQIGYNKRIFVMNLDRSQDRVFINPVILDKSDEDQVYREGCLSVPQVYRDLKSPKWLILRYFDEYMQEHTQKMEGLEAVCASHEIDHLNGVLMIDREEVVKSSP